jgi:hypothetical protein
MSELLKIKRAARRDAKRMSDQEVWEATCDLSHRLAAAHRNRASSAKRKLLSVQHGIFQEELILRTANWKRKQDELRGTPSPDPPDGSPA